MSAIYVDCKSLPSEWDAQETIRSRLRAGEPLVNDEKGSAVKIPRCVANHELLIPILAQIGSGCRLAEIDGLRDAVANIYSNNNRQATEDMVDDAAWSLRDMSTFVKRKASREEVSLEALGELCWLLFCFG